ncbi:uncharacterized protein LOC128883068 isoform X2 [Hylaeus volcanicus]|nr:uncharacterized protein LOC128883068 isoform X2 [Hylaeus volcanicus]
MDINKMSPLNSFNTTQQIHQRSDTCDFNKMLEDINTSSIYDIDDFLTPLVCNVMSGMSQNLTNGSIWYLRLPVYDETIQKYKTMQGLFVTLTSNKLFMHEHNMTQQMCSFQMPTPFYNSLPLVSWLSLNNKNELQLSFIHFEISTMKAFTFSLMGHSLLAHVKLNIKRCGRIAYDKVTKLLACCDVGFEETISTDFSSNSISQNVNVSSLKIFSLAQFGEQWVQCSKENVPALFPCSEYHLAQNERFCSITFASIQPNVSLIIAGTCLYVDNNSHFVLGNLYMFDCPTFEAIVSNKIVQPLLVRKVQLFPGPILYVGTLSLVNSFPYLVHTAGRKLFVNKMTDNGLTSGCFFDCPWTILSVATVKSYLAVSDGISGLYFLKFRSPVSLSLPTQSLSLLASFPVPISKKYILQGIAVEYTSQQQALYMISCNSEGTLDVLQYSTEQQHATSLQRSPNPFVFKRVTPLLGRVICSPMLHGQGPLVRFHRIETVHPPTMSCIALTLYG